MNFKITPELTQAQYTEANMSLAGLKGLDLKKANLICAGCKATEFEVYLASMEKQVEGGCDEYDSPYGSSGSGEYHKIVDVCTEIISLRRLFDIKGQEIARDVHVDDSQVIQKDAFDEIDEEDYSGWTGNEGKACPRPTYTASTNRKRGLGNPLLSQHCHCSSVPSLQG